MGRGAECDFRFGLEEDLRGISGESFEERAEDLRWEGRGCGAGGAALRSVWNLGGGILILGFGFAPKLNAMASQKRTEPNNK